MFAMGSLEQGYEHAGHNTQIGAKQEPPGTSLCRQYTYIVNIMSPQALHGGR